MKTSNLLIAGVVMSLLSTATFAAEQIGRSEASTLTQVGVVSSFGASDPNYLVSDLAKKAEAMGATKFRVVSLTGGENDERGTAIVYR